MIVDYDCDCVRLSCDCFFGVSETVLLKYNITSYELYGSSDIGCPLIFGVVFKDAFKIQSFGSNIQLNYGNVPKVLLEESDIHLYQLILDVPYGISSQLSFNVTNSNSETTLLTINKSFNCQKLLVPMDIDYVSNFKVGGYYSFNLIIGFNKLKYFSGIDLSSSLKCKLSFTAQCTISANIIDYRIYGFSFNESRRDELFKSNVTLTLMDLFGVQQVISIENNIINHNEPKTEIISYETSLPNATVFNPDQYSNLVSMKVTYKSSSLSSPLNSIPVLDTDGNSGPYFKDGYYILGAPDKKVYYYVFFIFSMYETTFDYKEFPDDGSGSNRIHLYYYSSRKISVLFEKLYPSYKLTLDDSMSKFILEVNVSTPYLSNAFYLSPARVYYDSNTTEIQHPYGLSRSISNSYYNYSTESLMFFSKTPTTQGIRFGGYSSFPDITIPDYPGILANDTSQPMIHSIKNQILENNKILTTLNISDSGSGLYMISGIQPSFSFYAKEYLVSGDTNNGIYQVLSDTSSISINFNYLFYYDEFGTNGLGINSMVYKDFDFNPPEQILKVISASDITFFEFDRQEIDTSFNDLELNLRVKFNGASETSVIPQVLLNYKYFKDNDNNSKFKGVYNKTSEMFDIKIRVQARENGNFEYSLSIPPLIVDSTQLETLFPDQIVKLTTNYVDHCPPSISGLKSLTDTQLYIPKGQNIKIGWNIEIYDYPTGLDYAIFQVVSNVDFEPFIFEFRPNASVPGSDILSNYTIELSVNPVENQTFYISKLELYDKNGYYSKYPLLSYVSTFDPFFNDRFLSERDIKVNVTQDSVSTYEFDNQAPELLTFSFPSSFDSFGINRTAICEFTLRDIGKSGISIRHNPYIYIRSMYSRSFRVQSELITINNETLVHHYRAVINFDYGYLAYGALISIDGITDNSLNIVSFTSQRLGEKGFTSTISNPIQTKPPVILEYSQLNEDGGKFFIYGREFKDSPILYMMNNEDPDDTFKVVPTSFKSNLAITAIVPSVKSLKSVQFKVVSNGISSNVINVEPIVNPISTVSNCSKLNDCNGKGECIDSTCVCIEGSEGPDCSSTTKSLDSKPKDNTPSFNSFNSMIEMYILEEIDIYGQVVKSYSLDSWYASTVDSQYHSADAFKYTQILKDTNTNITIVVDLFDSPLQINFATNKLQMSKGSIKYTITFNSYPFGSRFNTLLLKVNASISVQDSKCKLNTISLAKNSDNIEWIKLRSDDQSIYGKFIQNAILDYRSMSINNKLLVAPTNENQIAVVGIQIPYFFEEAILDPDFSVLFDVDNLGKNKESSCYVGETESSGSNENGGGNNGSNGLSNSKIITISVICGFVAISIFIASIILIKKRRDFFMMKKRLTKINGLN